MNILITGINGFIGKHLAKELIIRKHKVIGLGRDKQCEIEGVKKYYAGTVLDKKLIKKAIKDVEIVVHLAALTSHKEIIDNKFNALEINFLGTKNILDAFTQSKIAKKFFYTSTGKVYGKIIDLPINEKHPTHPLNVLGKSKLITEQLIDFYASTTLDPSKKEFIIFRIFNVYGPGQKSNFLVPTILAQLAKGKKEIMLGDIAAKRDYIFIDDVVNAFILAIEKKGKKGLSLYNICTGIGTSAAEIVETISKKIGKHIKINTNATLARPDEMAKEYGSYEKAKKEFCWEPKIGLAEGLTKLIQ